MGKHKILTTFCLLTFAAMITKVFCQNNKYVTQGNQSNSYCTSKTCERAANMLRSSIDMTVNPCVNFYKFACGKYPTSFPLKPNQSSRSYISDLSEEIENKVRDYLNQPYSNKDPVLINELRNFYRACLDADRQSKSKYETFQEFFSSVGLPILPIFQKDDEIDWLEIAAKLIQTGAYEFMFGVYVYRHANNQKLNTVYIRRSMRKPIIGYQWSEEASNFELMQYMTEGVSFVPSNGNVGTLNFKTGNNDGEGATDKGDTASKTDDNHQNKDEDKENKAEEPDIKVDTTNRQYFIKYMQSTMAIIRDQFQITSVNLEDPQLLQDLEKLFDFIYKKMVIENFVYLDGRRHEMMAIQNLQKKTDKGVRGKTKVNWRKYLNAVFSGNLNQPYEFDEEETIGVSDLNYIRNATWLLSKTETKIIVMAMWFELLEKFAPVTSKELRDALDGLRAELKLSPIQPLDTECTSTIMSKYSNVVSYMFTKEPDAYLKKYKVQVMTNLILNVFKKTLAKANWINPNTKVSALEKASRMRTYVGFEMWLGRPKEFAAIFGSNQILNGDVVKTILSYNAQIAQYNLGNLFNHNNLEESGSTMAPTVVNACYNPNYNSLTLPYAALHPPYYDYGIEALNFGSMGVVTAHEVTHGFDDNGKNYDVGGNANPWMTKDTTKLFRDGAKCFIESYGRLRVDEANENVNGELTLNENIADNGGIAMSFDAYQIYKRQRPDKILSGFEKFTHDQLFTLGYAMTQCGNRSPNSFPYLLRDEHTPPEQRINGLMMNFAEFPKIWGCSSNAPMNPPKKCKIW